MFVFFFLFSCFFSFSCVVVSSLNNEVMLLHVCVFCFFCNKTKWFLVCILWSSFFVCFQFCFFFLLFHSSPKKAKKPDTAKTPKNKCRKKGQLLSVGAGVFRNSVPNLGGGLNMHFCREHYKIAYFERNKNGPMSSNFLSQKLVEAWVKTWSKLESKIGPSMLRNIVGPVFDSRKWTFWPF